MSLSADVRPSHARRTLPIRHRPHHHALIATNTRTPATLSGPPRMLHAASHLAAARAHARL